MKCASCGFEITDDSMYCEKCGRPAQDLTPAPDTSSQHPPENETTGSKLRPGDREFQLRPLGFGEIFDYSFKLYFGNFWKLVVTVAIIMFPFHLLDLMFRTFSLYDQASSINSIIAFIAITIAWSIHQGAVIHIISNIYLGKPASIGDGYAAVRKKFFKITGAAFLNMIFCVLPLSTIYIMDRTQFPGTDPTEAYLAIAVIAISVLISAFLFIRFGLFDNIVMIENKGPMKSISRSSSLVSGAWWKMLLVSGLTIIMTTIIDTFFEYFTKALLYPRDAGLYYSLLPYSRFLSDLICIFLIPLGSILTIVFYYDRRVRKEGFDLERLAEEIIR